MIRTNPRLRRPAGFDFTVARLEAFTPMREASRKADVDDAQELRPLQRVAIPTGIALEIPPGFEGQVRPRSGRAFSEGLTLVNSPGTIDADYRGEIRVILINISA